MTRGLWKYTQILCAASLLGGCTAAFLDTAAHGIFLQEETNFTEKNYAAADYLIGQAQTYINRHNALIKALPLKDQAQPEMASDIGKMIPEQIGVRFSQLGYNVDLQGVATVEDTTYIAPAAGQKTKADYLLSGSFLRGRKDMDVSVRMTDAANGRVIAAFEYALPLTREVNDLASPQPKIMRMNTPPPTAVPVQ